MTNPLDPDSDDENDSGYMVGAFDPISAYVRTMHGLMRLADVTAAKPGVLPAHELLRATQAGLDTIAVINEATTRSVMGQVLNQVEESDWQAHTDRRAAVMGSWTDEEHHAYRMGLISHVAPFIPFEAMIPDTPEGMFGDEEPKDQ